MFEGHDCFFKETREVTLEGECASVFDSVYLSSLGFCYRLFLFLPYNPIKLTAMYTKHKNISAEK